MCLTRTCIFFFWFSPSSTNLRNNPSFSISPVHRTRLIQTCGTRTNVFFNIHQLPREPILSGPTYLTCHHDMTYSNMRHTNSFLLHYSSTTTRAHLLQSRLTHMLMTHNSVKRAAHELICSSIFINYHVSPSFPVPHISLVITT